MKKANLVIKFMIHMKRIKTHKNPPPLTDWKSVQFML